MRCWLLATVLTLLHGASALAQCNCPSGTHHGSPCPSYSPCPPSGLGAGLPDVYAAPGAIGPSPVIEGDSPSASLGTPPMTSESFTAPPVGSGMGSTGGFSRQASVAPSSLGNVAVRAPNYIDWAKPLTNISLRFDAGYNNPFPDRAEFFYPQCGCFGPTSRGPGTLPETNVDYQELALYYEEAFSDRFSIFVEAPVRFLNPTVNPGSSGFGDLNGGFKYALIADPCGNRYLTLQFRTYIPTGDGSRGLGTEHVSLEPAILYWSQHGKTTLFGEVRDWIPLNGSSDLGQPGEFAGNVLRYGLGIGRIIHETDRLAIAPVLEGVGWSILGGKFSDGMGQIFDAEGDTIFNLKAGVRFGFSGQSSLFGDGHSLAISYGRSLTGDTWYRDIMRAEYRIAF